MQDSLDDATSFKNPYLLEPYRGIEEAESAIMLTFKNEDGAGSRGEGEAVVPTENEERRHSSEEEEIAESSADEKVPSSIGEDQATG